MGYRIVARLWKGRGELPTLLLIGLSLAVAALTFAGDAIYILVKFNTTMSAVIETYLDFDAGLDMLRPGWTVLAAGLAVSMLNFVCARAVKTKPRQPRAAPRKDAAGEPARAAAGLL
jgi:hypothetical protein